jgi:hypothetical protein
VVREHNPKFFDEEFGAVAVARLRRLGLRIPAQTWFGGVE